MSFIARLGRGRTNNIYLLRGPDSTGKPAWYYLQVAPMKKPIFEHDVKKGQVELNSYGTILLSGYGEQPSPEAKKRMKDDYGFDEE